MNLFGISITRAKALQQPPSNSGGWRTVFESFPGAWQQNVEVTRAEVLTHSTVYACMTLIAGDIAKLALRLVARDDKGIWQETESPAFSPVLRKPNAYQTRIQFMQSWVFSLLGHGNTYVLKERDNRNVIVALYVLDPTMVVPLVSDSGDVYYCLKRDNLAGVDADEVIVPARDIIHDRINALHHPLVGVSAISAGALAASQGLRIQGNSSTFFANGARPSGILSAPGNISDETARRLKEHWETNHGGNNVGRIAVLGDGLKYEPMMMTAADSQLIEQLKWSAETICSVFHVPAYMVGIGPDPTHGNVEARSIQYYSQCLQILIEGIELSLDEGLELPKPYGTEFDLSGLLRMDTATQIKVLADAKNLMTLDERRARLDLPGITGGGTVYMQEQDHSIEAIAARDAMLIDQSKAPPALPPVEPPPALPPPDETERAVAAIRMKFAGAIHA